MFTEKDLHVCEELLESNCVKEVANRWEWTLGFYLSTETLLKAVITISHEKFPMNFCLSKFNGEERCVMKIEDTKVCVFFLCVYRDGYKKGRMSEIIIPKPVNSISSGFLQYKSLHCTYTVRIFFFFMMNYLYLLDTLWGE